ncbi:MAG: ferric reductase-like transmembrane domain-containing protein [Woeseiaceae bacterium]
MKALVATLAVVFVVTFLAAPTMGAGWFWDTGNAIGFAAFGGLLYLTITSVRRLDVRAHQVLGYGVLLVAVAHAFWFLLGDAAAIEFMKPGAPDYMWLGLVCLVSLGVLITVALVPDRFRLHNDYSSFKYWHRVVAIVTLASGTYHILVSNFYLGAWYQATLFIMIVIAVASARSYWARLGQIKIVSNVTYLFVSGLFGMLFVAIRNLPL